MYDRWVQGLRTHQANAGSDWREVIFGRLNLDYSKITQGAKTTEAESGLGIPSSVYYYIGRCEPEFGDSALRFDAREHAGTVDAPFDTGGIWAEHIQTEPKLVTGSEKAAFVQLHSEPHGRRSMQFAEWLSANFEPESDYLIGVEPRVGGFCAEVVTADMGSRSWVWEARVERAQLPKSGLKPVELVLSRRRYNQYHAWLLRNDKLSTTTKLENVRLLTAIYNEPDSLTAADYVNRQGASSCQA